MKKYIILFMLSLYISPAFANTFFEPQWNEFCPSQYANLDLEKDYILAEKKYWQQRKKDFNRKLRYCNVLSDNQRGACYDNLRLVESNATSTHLAEVRIKQQEYANAASMTNAFNYQINTMNNLLNNRPYYYGY